MLETKAEIVSDECHRLQTELRQTSQRNLVKGLLDTINQLRFDVWAEKSTPMQILSPFKEIIDHPNLTDVITSVAVSSVYNFILAKIFETEEDISTVVQCLCSCQYQITTDTECLNLSIQILRCFNLIVENYSNFLSLDSADSIFHYCEQDVRQLSYKCIHTTVLSEVFGKISFLIVNDEKYESIVSDTLSILFSIADLSYMDSGWVARSAAISALLLCAKSHNKTMSRELLKMACVIINQQLEFTDSRDNFVMSIRLFFLVFKDEWMKLPLLFARILNSILDCCLTQAMPEIQRCTCFEILIDFVSQKRFFLNFYANYSNRPFFPQLFEKFMNAISFLANIQSPVQEVQTSALALISTIIEQLNDEKSDMQMGNAEHDSGHDEQWKDEAEQLKKLTEFAKEFNEHPTFCANTNLTPKECAFNILTAPGIKKASIGDFFSKNTPFALETLSEFLNYLDFEHLTFDQSIRLFLTSFTILGEGQVIDRNTEAFAKSYFAAHSNDGVFKDEKAAHILAYGWLMIHTSMHNQNVTKKTSLPEFFSMMKGQNGEEDFDSQFLTTIYNSIKRSQVEIGDEKCDSVAFWELLIQKQRVLNLQTLPVETPTPAKFVISLFKEVWEMATPIFTSIYEKSTTNTQSITETFVKCASISTKYGLHDILDNIVSSLCKFTYTVTKHALSEERAKDSLKALSTIIIEYGAQIHEGWKSFSEILLGLFKYDLLPEDMRKEPVLIGKQEMLSISADMFSHGTKQHSTTPSFLSVFKLLGSTDSNENGDESADLHRAELKTFISECHFEKIVDESVAFTPQSLNYLMQSLITIAKEAQSMFIERAAEAIFCIHLITQIAIANCDRISPLWTVISQHFSSIFSETVLTRTGIIFLQRAVTNIFTLANHMWGQPKLRNELIKLTDFSTNVDPKIFVNLIQEHLAGFQQFLNLHISSYIAVHQFKSLNKTLVSSVGVEEPSAAKLLHTFIQGIGEDKEPPGLDRFNEYWMPLVQTTVVFCIRDPSPDTFSRFSDLYILLLFGGATLEPAMWEFVFESTLFPALEHVPNEITQQRNTKNVGERCLLMTKTIFKVFLQVHKEISELPNFEQLWNKLLQLSINAMKFGDVDLKSSIPQLLANALMVMKSSGVFDSDSRKKMWNESRAIIEPFVPYFAQLCE